MSRPITIASLSVLAALMFAPVTKAADPDVAVKWKTEKQEIDGFGGSGAYLQALNLMSFPEPQRTEVLDLLFSTTKGAGISIIRNIIGDGGETADGGRWGKKSDGPSASIQPKEGQWSWTGDEDQVWLMKEAKKRGCTRFISAAWSPPAWMKTNNSVIDGSNLKKDKYRAYAEYLAEYVNGYKKHHDLEIYAVSPQNEPTFTGGYSCCQWSPEDFLDFTKNHIIPVFKEKKVAAKYMLGEHMFWDEGFAVPSLNDPIACERVDIVAAHGYGAPNGYGVLPVATAKGKKIWETEVYNNADQANNSDGRNTIENALYWAEYIHNHMTVSQANAWLYWWLMAKYNFEGTLVTLPEPVVDQDMAAFKSDLVTRQTPGRSIDIDVNMGGGQLQPFRAAGVGADRRNRRARGRCAGVGLQGQEDGRLRHCGHQQECGRADALLHTGWRRRQDSHALPDLRPGEARQAGGDQACRRQAARQARSHERDDIRGQGTVA